MPVTYESNLRARREELGLSRRALAEQAQISPSLVEFIEGGYRNFSEAIGHRLCRALDLNPDELT